MNRLQLEVRRLFAVQPPEGGDGLDGGDGGNAAAEPRLVDEAGRVRALVLQVSRPADWAVLSRVWQGVQADLGWSAPAIAVAGQDGYQLWFSLATPVSAGTGRGLLEALRLRYLADVPLARVTLLPAVDDALSGRPRHLARVPALLAPGGPWSAFVSADLAPVFADEPWLDAPPAEAGQAELLSRLSSLPLADAERALASGAAGAPAAGPAATAPSLAAAAHSDPRAFLLGVMNDPGVDLALRIEAAKALLPAFDAQPARCP